MGIHKSIVAGTSVRLEGIDEWCAVSKVFGDKRMLIKVLGYEGCFQKGHILKFSNSIKAAFQARCNTDYIYKQAERRAELEEYGI